MGWGRRTLWIYLPLRNRWPLVGFWLVITCRRVKGYSFLSTSVHLKGADTFRRNRLVLRCHYSHCVWNDHNIFLRPRSGLTVCLVWRKFQVAMSGCLNWTVIGILFLLVSLCSPSIFYQLWSDMVAYASPQVQTWVWRYGRSSTKREKWLFLEYQGGTWMTLGSH